MNNYSRKLQSALIETGKEVEAIAKAPALPELEDNFERLRIAIQSNDVRKMRSYGRHMAAMIIKMMIEKL
jgi:hypothetical protein